MRVEADTFDVSPNLGVRHEDLHLVVDRACGRRSEPTPTLVRLLGYVMPQNSSLIVWEFRRDDDTDWVAQAANMAQHIESYGIPWMDRFRSLDEILAGIDAGLSLHRPYLRPAALMLLNRRAEALEQLDEDVRNLGYRTDLAAAHFRRFAEALKTQLDAAT
jgi:hypothetical protein